MLASYREREDFMFIETTTLYCFYRKHKYFFYFSSKYLQVSLELHTQIYCIKHPFIRKKKKPKFFVTKTGLVMCCVHRVGGVYNKCLLLNFCTRTKRRRE